MDEFKIPPVSTLAGSTISNYFKILRQGRISPRYYWKIFLTTLIVLISTPFQLWEYFVYARRVKRFRFIKAPVFILGHWRSGTTHLHNLLARDPQFGFVSTYQALFPNNLSSKLLFKTFMKINMPDKRPTDNMKMNVNYPQEDEFAFSNCQENAYYNFFYFPSRYKEFFDKAVLHKNLKQSQIERWYNEYDKLLKKALINSGKEQIIVKNPVNTARIDKILKRYPDAKFIFIYRNPVTVFFSTRNFLRKWFPTLWFHKVDNDFIDEMIIDIYIEMMELYEKYKSLIPSGNLMEIKFEELEEAPVQQIEKIYNKLLKNDFNVVKPLIKSYSNSQKNYQKNMYTADNSTMKKIQEKWRKYIEKYNYEFPEDIAVSNDVKT